MSYWRFLLKKCNEIRLFSQSYVLPGVCITSTGWGAMLCAAGLSLDGDVLTPKTFDSIVDCRAKVMTVK